MEPTENKNTIRLELKGKELYFTADIDQAQSGQIIQLLAADSTSPLPFSPIGITTANQNIPHLRNKAPKEALIETKAKTNPEKMVAFGALIMDLNNKESFSITEVKDMYKKAGEPIPHNFGRDIRSAVKLAYIYSVGDELYTLSDTGKEKIERGFSDEANFNAQRSRKAKSGKNDGIQKSIRDEVKNLAVTTNLKGYPNYHDVKTKGKRILWILQYADSHGIESLSSTEIASIAERLKDQIPTRDFSAFNKENIKRGNVMQKGSQFKILQPGIEVLKQKQES